MREPASGGFFVFVRRSRVLLAVILVGAAAVPLSGCAVAAPAQPHAPPSDAAELTPDERWWWAVEVLTHACMTEQGFPNYALTPPWEPGVGPRSADEWIDSVTIERRESAHDALLGTPGSIATPSWRATGCYGRALHDVGVD
ncbi:MAG: hypothetical protein EPO52_11135 [Herbiconiux sp.]|uniref:hypothetical protein n=1 Tax=Herbiconiux sp. TaxID=1871186 RepID=UPI001206B5C3|nr:hypothetical protein [Herbiconiux sp.]TAJ48656.1 MAG: hypothetical protein EPO52_11135 [Herbiconiux sp.]